MIASGESKQGHASAVIAADLGGTNLRVALIDERGQIIARTKERTPQSAQAQNIVQALAIAARECASKADSKLLNVCGLSIAVPGRIEAASGTVAKIPNLPCLNEFPLRAALEEKTGWSVTLENDANAAAIGEMWQGAARNHKSILCVTLGTGVGGGIVLDERLWRGAHGAAGEIGHITVEPEGIVCACGNQGCLEVYASATGIVRLAREAKIETNESNEELTAETIYKMCAAGDDRAREVFRRMGRYLGIGLASIVNVIDPEIIVIGGGAANAWDSFIEQTREEIKCRAFSEPQREVSILRATCGDDAGLLGAAKLAFETRD
jgi:glucokinase